MIDLFIFHIPENDSEDDPRFILMEMMITSAKRVCDIEKIHLYTWSSSRIPPGLSVDNIVRISPEGVARTDVQLARTYAIMEFLKSDLFSRNTISVEYDQLFQKSPEYAFSYTFDVGLTYACSSKKRQEFAGKINGGVSFWRKTDRVLSYYRAYLKQFELTKDDIDTRFTIEGKNPKRKEWGGDECVHVDLLPGELFEDGHQVLRSLTILDAKIMLMPADEFNCQLGRKNGNDSADLPYLEKTTIRHFHGWKKHFMAKYAKQLLKIDVEAINKKIKQK